MIYLLQPSPHAFVLRVELANVKNGNALDSSWFSLKDKVIVFWEFQSFVSLNLIAECCLGLF